MTDRGPYETERQARAAALAAVPPEEGWSILRAQQCRQLLGLACEATGIELGTYDERVLDWISGFEDSACAVFAGLIRRAHEAGKAAGPDGAVTEWALAYTHRPDVSGVPRRRVVQPYPDEQSARAAVADVKALAPEDEPGLMRRELGPWKEVPGV